MFGVAADDHATANAVHKASIAARRQGKRVSGLRPGYHPSYCGDFVPDPDSNNFEEACHTLVEDG